HAAHHRQLFGGEDAVNVEDHDELRLALAHALDEIGADLGADSGGGLNLVRFEIDDFLDRIGQRADHRGFAVEQHFDHHDAGVAGALSLRHLETEAQIDHRNDTSPQI